MLKNDKFALALTFFWVFLYESMGSPYFGFYAIPATLAILFYFYSPLSSRDLNFVLAFFCGFLFGSVINANLIFFSAPFFIILSLILYVFAKK